MRMPRPLAVAAGLTLVLTAGSAHARHYTFRALGTQAGIGDGGGLNQRGHAAATVTVGSDLHVDLYRRRNTLDLGVGGAQAINDADQVAGFVNTPDFQRHAAVWLDGTPTDLGTFGGSWAMANAINDAAVVTGIYQDATGFHPFRWWRGTMTTLVGITPGEAVAEGINDVGDIVGASPALDGVRHATLWRRGGAVVDLGTLGTTSQAFAVNHRLQVVGNYFGPSGRPAPFEWERGAMTALPTFAGEGNAWAIAECGAIVGESNIDPTAPGNQHAVLWEDGQLVDLQPFAPAGWRLLQARGIDDRGQIFGWAQTADGFRPFLLTPAD